MEPAGFLFVVLRAPKKNKKKLCLLPEIMTLSTVVSWRNYLFSTELCVLYLHKSERLNIVTQLDINNNGGFLNRAVMVATVA